MASIIYTPRDIYEQEFKTSLRGFDKVEVDEFLDNVISDYELFLAEIKKLKQENAELKAKVAELEEGVAQVESLSATQPFDVVEQEAEPIVHEEIPPVSIDTSIPTVSNYDLLRRISRLELEVFGKNIEK